MPMTGDSSIPSTHLVKERSGWLLTLVCLAVCCVWLPLQDVRAAAAGDWDCAQDTTTGRWSCSRNGRSSAQSSIEDNASQAIQPASEQRAALATGPALATDSGAPVTTATSPDGPGPLSGTPIDTQAGTPIESIAERASAAQETVPPASQPVAEETAPAETGSAVTPTAVPTLEDEAIAPQVPDQQTADVNLPNVSEPAQPAEASIDAASDAAPDSHTERASEAAAAVAEQGMAERIEPAIETGTETALSDNPAPDASPVADANLPDYQRLAYVPEQPTSLLELPGEFWVAQLMAVSSKEFLETYAEEKNLRGLSAARIASGNRLFFVLILGIYQTEQDAKQAITNLPPPYHRYRPLLRTLASLQKAMRRADEMTGTSEF